MNIVIFEKGHFEVCHTILKLLDTTSNNVIVCTDEPVKNHLSNTSKHANVTWVIKLAEESNRQYLTRAFNYFNSLQVDLIYLSTVSDNYHVYAQKIKQYATAYTVLTLHDVNNFFKFPPRPSPRCLVRWYGKRKLRHVIDGYTVLSTTLVPALSKANKEKKAIYTVPGSLFEQEIYQEIKLSRQEPIKIVIPGSVDIRRRNYDAVFSLLHLAKLQKIEVDITFAGILNSKYSNDIRKKIEDWQSKHSNLHIFENELSMDDFSRVINDSHLIWSPLQPSISVHDGISEEYGRTISSGNIGDIIRHARPFFAPHFLNTDHALRSSGLFYNKIDDLLHFLRQITPDKYNQLLALALHASMSYTKEKVLEGNQWLRLSGK